MSLSEQDIFYLEKTFSQSASDIAHILRYFYYDFVRFDGRNWFYFKQFRWICLEVDDSPLGHLLRNDLVNKYLQLSSRYNLEAAKSSSEDFNLHRGDLANQTYLPLVVSNLTYKSKVCLEISSRISDHAYFQRIMLTAHELFTDRSFGLTLDNNVDLIGFSNGVYDLSSGVGVGVGEGSVGVSGSVGGSSVGGEGSTGGGIVEVRANGFRLPRSQDRVFMEVGYQFTSGMKYEKEIRAWFSQGLDGLLPLLGAMLSGRNRMPPIWVTGLTDTTYRDLYQLIKWTFGDYLGEMPFSDLRKRKISKSETHSCLIGNCKKRLVIVEHNVEDYPSVNPNMVDFLLSSELLKLRLPHEIDHLYTPQFGLMILSKHRNAEPTSEFRVFNLGESGPKLDINRSDVPKVVEMPLLDTLRSDRSDALRSAYSESTLDDNDESYDEESSEFVKSQHIDENWKYDMIKILLEYYR